MSQLTGVLGLDRLEPLVRFMALSLPVLVLLTLVFVLKSRAIGRMRRHTEILPVLNGGAGQTLGSRAPLDKFEEPPDNDERLQNKVAPQDADPPKANLQTPLSAVALLQLKLSQAESLAQNPGLARLYLDLAAAHRKAGDEAASLAALRSAAGLAAKDGPHSAHAEARLQLAEAAYDGGDLTGACEQWQMARVALQEAGDHQAQARVDKRMRDNGCPTDWVLTDF